MAVPLTFPANDVEKTNCGVRTSRATIATTIFMLLAGKSGKSGLKFTMRVPSISMVRHDSLGSLLVSVVNFERNDLKRTS